MFRYSSILATSALVLCGGAAIAQEEVSSDGVPVVPVFLDNDGNGIMRYEDPTREAQEYVAAVGGLFDDGGPRPFEVLGALGGPWIGPNIAICIEGIRADRTMDGALAFELYSNTYAKPVMRFRPVFDTEKAEKITTVGEGAGPGECSKKYAP